MIAIVTRIPEANNKEIRNARFVDIRPCSSINPIISGILARWHGLRMMLNIPQVPDVITAIKMFEFSDFVSVSNMFISII
jgi:hypothetical protein